MFIHSDYVSRIRGHILISNDIVSIFPATLRSIFQKIKHCRTIVITLKVIQQWRDFGEWQKLTWRHAQDLVSLRVMYKFVNLNSTLVICLRFVFSEMLDKLITYIVCLYKTLYHVLPVVRTNRIATPRLVEILVHTTDSTWYKVL
jgi:hypothetical protein